MVAAPGKRPDGRRAPAHTGIRRDAGSGQRLTPGLAGPSSRSASLDDLDAITDLHTQTRTAYYPAGGLPESALASSEARSRRREDWMRAIRSDAKTVVCAKEDGEMVGTLAMGPPLKADVNAATVGQLHQIHVRPSRWGRGVGGQLRAAFVQFFRDGSLAMGLLEAWEGNGRAQAFYAWHGWKPDGYQRPGPGNASSVCMCLNSVPAPCRSAMVRQPACVCGWWHGSYLHPELTFTITGTPLT
ncbi:GNAT family N-acetyltransferase [Streptomyces sp. NPDC048506]|uniref:GNAT family N-acetyltransferase n=1 Tax=Streptomyces sp. NPDC048506 TaxID=3155028 RepID=UPI003439FF4B